MAPFQRRRNQNNNNLLIPVISTISTALLLFLALLSYLAPPPLDHRHHQHSSAFNIGLEAQKDDFITRGGFKEEVFRVPIGGGSSSSQGLWISRTAKFYYGCSNASNKFPLAQAVTAPNRYLSIATSGGLNQQRTGITDAVVAARILNATLVVPTLDQKSFWKDSSNFTEIFDVDWFISFLSKDVKIIKQLPRKGGKVMSAYRMRVPRKCNAKCYQSRVLPVLLKKHAVQLTKFDYRLANKLDTDLQKLRCRVNYHALKFTEPILQMGRQLVQRMKMSSRHFITLHLRIEEIYSWNWGFSRDRFEPDMLAFSGCYYGGGDRERKELGAIRKRWKTLHNNNPDRERRQGRCPLTPEEVGLMLRALGFGNDVHIYVASGEVYRGEETLAPLKALFPNLHSKDTIASKEELAPFSTFSSRMAALDFIVCDESDVFVTNNNGNMARILAGRRKYFGHKRTIRPNAKKLYSLFLNRTNMTWEAFVSRVRTHQRGFMGEPHEVRPGRGEFHENPSTCICEHPEAKAKANSGSQGVVKFSPKIGIENDAIKDTGEPVDDQSGDDELEWPDMDYGDQNGIQDKDLANITDTDYNLFVKPEEQPELEDLLSD